MNIKPRAGRLLRCRIGASEVPPSIPFDQNRPGNPHNVR